MCPNLDPFNQVGVVLNTDFEYEVTYATPPSTGRIDISLSDVVGGGFVYLQITNPWNWFDVQNATLKSTEQLVRESPNNAVWIDPDGNAFLKVVVEEGGSATTIQLVEASPPATLIQLNPVDDAYLAGAVGHNDAYLKVQDALGDEHVSYLKFDVQGLAGRSVQQATLRLTVAGESGAGPIRLYRGATDSWDEHSLTIANAPPLAGVLDAAAGTYEIGSQLEFELTDAIIGDGPLSLALKIGSGSDDVWFSSSEGDAPPTLLLDFSPPEPTGDFDANGKVTGSDLLIWQRGFATPQASLSDGDGDHDGDVDELDLALWQQQYGGAVAPVSAAGGAPMQTPPIQIASDQWVAADAFGRQLPGFAEVGPPRPGKYVGLFYFLWHGQHNANAVYDITEIIAANPSDPQYGPVSAFHWWGQPEEGYFRAEDPWVIQRNLRMLADIGVDVLFFDVTNAFTYRDNAVKVMRIARDLRAAGIETPSFAFLTHSSTVATVNDLYNNIYSQGLLSEVWFHWQGKPLILGDESASGLSQEVRDFFTWRFSWAWTNAAAEPHHWQWIDTFPQDYGWDVNPSVAEQIPVAVASHATNNRGSSYSGGTQPAVDELRLSRFTGTGRHFDEQWTRVHQVDPELVFVTGWNEWVAQRFVKQPGSGASHFLGEPLAAGDTYFVDLYNQEFMRDIAPMQGGHTDNYYYQLAAEIRRFKGVRPPADVAASTTLTIDGQFADWIDVGPQFSDFSGDTLHRDWPRYDLAVQYVNQTGRNDIVESRVGADGTHVYFYAETASALSPSSDPQWMLLFIDADQNRQTGWEGFDFAANLQVLSDQQTTLSQWNNGQWESVGILDYRSVGNQLEIAVDRSLIAESGATVDFDFHWADNVGPLDDISAFFVNGDSAPNRRFNYRFSANAPFQNPASGDFNSDGQVSGVDLLAWQVGFGIAANASLADGDGDGDGDVDGDDLGIWQQQYHGPAATAAEVAAAPPFVFDPSTRIANAGHAAAMAPLPERPVVDLPLSISRLWRRPSESPTATGLPSETEDRQTEPNDRRDNWTTIDQLFAALGMGLLDL